VEPVSAGVRVLDGPNQLVSERSLIYAAGMSPRASALPPSERRVSIVRAALHLIAERGTMPTTREVAEEAGIAEGTVFRAFDTKERLVDAVVGETFCPVPVSQRMQAIDMSLPLHERMVEVVTVFQGRFTEIFGVMSALGLTAPPGDVAEHRGCRPDTGHVPVEEQDPATDSAWDDQPGRLLAFVEPDADRLTCSPAELISYLRLFTFSASHPDITQGRILSPQTIVAVVLDGVTRKAS
jgi:AcrR family transcriptional regulator